MHDMRNYSDETMKLVKVHPGRNVSQIYERARKAAKTS